MTQFASPARLSLLDLSRPQLADLLAGWDQPRYRADQIWSWLHEKQAAGAAEMTNLPAALRERLAAETCINPLEQVYEQRASDGQTIKWLFRLPDGLTIETVLMLYPPGEDRDERRTVCISTQAGCAMGCVFCATGQAGLARNLAAGEIVAQVFAAERWLTAHHPSQSATHHLTNVVVMGMGEPMANYDRTWQALRIITDKDGFNLGARHITVSTVGLPPGIRKMAEEPLQINLAVSLHAANDLLRTQLVPINQRYPLAEVMTAVREYVARTNRRVTFEYALMRDINDLPTQAHELAALLKGLLCHVNLIPLNPVAESPYQPSTEDRATGFQEILEQHGIPATMRQRRGIDIDAGCGQLRRRVGSS